MNRLTITCASCGQAWGVPYSFSLHEQQAVESCPCPRCAAYTLCCREAAEPTRAPRAARLFRAPHAVRAAG